MSSALQNRLVGTIILVALIVIFLPDILDGRKESNQDLFVDMPQRPTMRSVPHAQEFPTEAVKEAATRNIEVLEEQAIDDPATKTDATGSVQTTGQDQSTDAATAPGSASEESSLQQETVVTQDTDRLLESAGWVVQLGAFRHSKNVRDMLDKLQAAGYRAFSRPVKTSSGELTKVFVGPDLQKDKLEKALPHLNELTNVQGRITPFTVK